MTVAAAAEAGSVSRGTLLSQPRSGARPLGNSPGAGPGDGPAPPGPGPQRTNPPRDGARAPTGGAAGPSPKRGPSSTSSTPRSRPAGSSASSPQSRAQNENRGRGKKDAGLFGGRLRRGAAAPAYHNYQAIILVEFVAAELLVAATPMATRKNQPGLSPYVPRDLVQLMAIGVVFLVLEMIAAGGRGAGRISAWLGGLVLLTVGLNEAADLAKVFAFITGGTGNEPSTISLTAAGPPTSIQTYLQNAPTLTTNESLATVPGGPGPLPTGPGGPKSGAGFVQEAAKFIGDPYIFGAAGPNAFDCSGLVEYALGKIGITAPRTSEEQWAWVQRIPQSQLAPGDLVFEQWPGEVSPGHVAIYSGPGQIIQAPAPGEKVQRAKWSPSIVHAEGGQIVGFGRVPGLSY